MQQCTEFGPMPQASDPGPLEPPSFGISVVQPSSGKRRTFGRSVLGGGRSSTGKHGSFTFAAGRSCLGLGGTLARKASFKLNVSSVHAQECLGSSFMAHANGPPRGVSLLGMSMAAGTSGAGPTQTTLNFTSAGPQSAVPGVSLTDETTVGFSLLLQAELETHPLLSCGGRDVLAGLEGASASTVLERLREALTLLGRIRREVRRLAIRAVQSHEDLRRAECEATEAWADRDIARVECAAAVAESDTCLAALGAVGNAVSRLDQNQREEIESFTLVAQETAAEAANTAAKHAPYGPRRSSRTFSGFQLPSDRSSLSHKLSRSASESPAANPCAAAGEEAIEGTISVGITATSIDVPKRGFRFFSKPEAAPAIDIPGLSVHSDGFLSVPELGVMEASSSAMNSTESDDVSLSLDNSVTIAPSIDPSAKSTRKEMESGQTERFGENNPSESVKGRISRESVGLATSFRRHEEAVFTIPSKEEHPGGETKQRQSLFCGGGSGYGSSSAFASNDAVGRRSTVPKRRPTIVDSIAAVDVRRRANTVMALVAGRQSDECSVDDSTAASELRNLLADCRRMRRTSFSHVAAAASASFCLAKQKTESESDSVRAGTLSKTEGLEEEATLNSDVSSVPRGENHSGRRHSSIPTHRGLWKSQGTSDSDMTGSSCGLIPSPPKESHTCRMPSVLRLKGTFPTAELVYLQKDRMDSLRRDSVRTSSRDNTCCFQEPMRRRNAQSQTHVERSFGSFDCRFRSMMLDIFGDSVERTGPSPADVCDRFREISQWISARGRPSPLTEVALEFAKESVVLSTALATAGGLVVSIPAEVHHQRQSADVPSSIALSQSMESLRSALEHSFQTGGNFPVYPQHVVRTLEIAAKAAESVVLSDLHPQHPAHHTDFLRFRHSSVDGGPPPYRTSFRAALLRTRSNVDVSLHHSQSRADGGELNLNGSPDRVASRQHIQTPLCKASGVSNPFPTSGSISPPFPGLSHTPAPEYLDGADISGNVGVRQLPKFEV